MWNLLKWVLTVWVTRSGCGYSRYWAESLAAPSLVLLPFTLTKIYKKIKMTTIILTPYYCGALKRHPRKGAATMAWAHGREIVNGSRPLL